MPVIVYTTQNVASANIAEELKKICPDAPIMKTDAPTVLDVPVDFDTDYIIVLSTHKSEKAGPMITAHFPGNWDSAELGGEPKTLNFSFGSKIKDFLKAVNGKGWPVVLEVDHHGPTPKRSTPIIFVEIGSTAKEWENKQAASIVAEGVVAMLGSNKTYPCFLGVGGGHYAKSFTKLVLESDYAAGHLLPKYSIDKIDYAMFKQAIENSVEPIEKVLVLSEETNKQQKEKIRLFSEHFKIPCEEIKVASFLQNQRPRCSSL